jgi:hypothetical protein
VKVYRPVPPTAPHAGVRDAPLVADVRRVGIVDDNLDPPLMHGVVEQLRAMLPVATIDFRVKPIGTSPAPDSLIEQMAREVQVAITGVGM